MWDLSDGGKSVSEQSWQEHFAELRKQLGTDNGGDCPCLNESLNPMAFWFCPYGHATECHYPLECEEAAAEGKCAHYEEEEF